MKKSRQVNRPLLRSGRNSKGGLAKGGARLASMAGGSGRPVVDQLEPRQLLFSLTISPTDVDPNTGIGTVRAVFAYAIPSAFTNAQIVNNAPTVVDEDFNDEFPPTPGAPLPNVQNFPSGRVLLGSFIRINHNIIPTSNFQVRAVLDNVGAPTGERFLQARPDIGQFFEFRPQTQGGLSQGVSSMTFTVRGAQGSSAGLDAARFSVQLFFRGVVTQTFTGAQLLAQGNGTGVGRFTFTANTANPAFDGLRILATDTGADAFIVDELQYTAPAGNFVENIVNRVSPTAEVFFSGRVGSSARFLDLYGREIFQTIALGVPNGGTLALGDLNDDGIPDINDGIGSITLVNADESTSLTIFGGLTAASTTPDADVDFFEGGFAYKRIENLTSGLYDYFEATGGFGFDIDNTIPNTPPAVHGLPGNSGSVIIGSPIVRDNTNAATYNPSGLPLVNGVQRQIPITSGFANPTQGIFVQGNRNIGGVYIHGMLFGSSNFTGSVERIVVSNLYGSITVAGDLGTLIVAGEAGTWQRDVGRAEIRGFVNGIFHTVNPAASADVQVKTFGQLIVGRTVGEISIGGRSLLDITVQGIVSDPVNHPARISSTYFEKEYIYSNDPATPEPETDIAITLAANGWSLPNAQRESERRRFTQADQSLIFGSGFYRNDALLSAEWLNTLGTGTRVIGDLSGRSKINTQDDQSDVYAFASDGTTPISIEMAGFFYFRILDENGRTVAAPSITRGSISNQFVRYQPTTPGVYYVVVTDPSGDDGGFAVTPNYSFTILGMAPVTLGSYRTGGNSGSGAITRSSVILNNSINVLSGNVGSIRIGTGRANNAGAGEISTQDISNSTAPDADAFQDWLSGSFNIPGNLYNITTGSDTGRSEVATGAFANGFVDITVGGDFGSFITGQSALAGRGPTEGDVNFFTLRVGGRIALIDVRGASGMDSESTPITSLGGSAGTTQYLSGRSGGNGDIGLVRYGSHIANDAVRINTSPGSTVGGILVSQDVDLEATNILTGLFDGNVGVLTNIGSGSDVRFVDFPRIDTNGALDVTTRLIVGQVATFVDDGGGQVRIRVVGNAASNGLIAGVVRVLPINGSQGVAIGQINVDLTGNGFGGLTLEIESVGAAGSTDVTSIGRIIVTAADPLVSGITIRGNVQTDVWRIDGLAPLLFVRNETPLGDIVMLNLAGLTTLNIVTGDLGRTQVPAWGPRLIGSFLGIGAAGNTSLTREQPLTLPAPDLLIDFRWDGTTTYRPVDRANIDIPLASLDDIGSPFDPYLNGLLVRTGVLDTVNVGGAVGDVIALAGNIIRVNANFDRVTPASRFDGIVGSIYSGGSISRVDIGDGLAQRDQAPLSTTGIFALNDIVRVLSENSRVANISSSIIAANSIAGDLVNDGIDTIDLRGGGSITRAFIGSKNIDAFWVSYNYSDINTNSDAYGDINLINIADGNLFSSEIQTSSVRNITITNGFYDATFTNARADIGTISATGFRNSTLKGTDVEFSPNAIQAARNLGTLTTTARAGTIADLILDIKGSVTSEISSLNFDRVDLDVDNTLPLLRVGNDFRASKLAAGTVASITVGRSIQSSKIIVAGPLPSITVVDSIVNADIEVSGPDGRIGTITARNLISGSVRSAGPIDTIDSTAGDVRLAVTTTSPRGNVNILRARGDLDLTTDISGTVNTLIAGRHIGNRANPGAIVIRGNLQNATAGGQLYSDLRVGQSITGQVSTSIVASFPSNNLVGSGSIIAFGSINAVNSVGDFGGDIISYSGGINTINIFGGSFLPNRTIAAYAGSINLVAVTFGNLYGNIHADQILYNVTVTADQFSIFGDIGVNPKYNTQQAYDNFRNRLPVGIAPGVAVQGPRITAGWNIGRVLVTNGSIFEATIIAGRAIGTIEVRRGADVEPNAALGIPVTTLDNGNITTDGQTVTIGNTIAAGDSIFSINVQGDLNLAFILSGTVNFGADQYPGGTGANRDTIKWGFIESISVRGNVYALVISSGMDTGVDGIYNTADDRVEPGASRINTVTLAGAASFVSVYCDSINPALQADTRIFTAGPRLQLVDDNIDPVLSIPGTPIGAGGLSFTRGSESGTVFFSGPGEAFYDASTYRVVVVNSNFNSNLTVNVTSANGALTDFRIVSNDDATINSVVVNGDLRGNSLIDFDSYVGSISVRNFSGTGSIRVGQDVATITLGDFLGGTLAANYIATVRITGNYGALVATTRDEALISVLSAGSIAIGGANRGAINSERDIGSFTVGEIVDSATLRAGGALGAVDVGATSRTWISAGDSIASVNVRGNFFDSSILAGGDLGSDTEFGGFGLDADTVRTGSIGPVTVAGDFAESDLAAGILRGADGFFGTSDDNLAEGRSTIGNVTITGRNVGSTRNSESYIIASTGRLGVVTIGGVAGVSSGNFSVTTEVLPPLPFAVTDLRVTQDARVYTAAIQFNQAIDSSTIGAALGVYEVRGPAQTEIRLVNGVDYTLTYNSATDTVLVRFAPAITNRALPEQTGVPGPGVYRFRLEQALLRAQLVNARLDGNVDGKVGVNDNYSADDIVGDAGDKLVNQTTTVPGTTTTVDFRAATDLNAVLDDNRTPDGLPDINKVYTLRGTIGDHKDNDTDFFRFGGDTDVYRITLQAGQTLRLGQVFGPARLVSVNLVADTSNVGLRVGLPSDLGDLTNDTFEQNFLVKTTGTYYIVVGAGSAEFTDPSVVPNPDAQPNTVGNYSFTVQVFDDGDSGFNATTDAGNGTNVVNAPAPTTFAGVDGVFGTADDLPSVSIGGYVFTYSRGADGRANTADDLVSGTDSSGKIASTRTGTGVQTSVINAAIGPAGHTGVPQTVFADVDIFHLNNRLPIATGSKVRITVQLTSLGADLGSRNQASVLNTFTTLALAQDLRPNVQFALFDTTDSTGVDDARLVFSPTDFSSNGGRPGTLVAGDNATYGFDASGDFFIEFIAPGRQGNATQNATYAVYLQGAFNTDYRIQVVSNATDGGVNSIIKTKQNVLIETRGGSINWLEASGAVTNLSGFSAAVLGFTGTQANGQTVQNFLIQEIRNALQQVFDAAGLQVNFSTDPRDFEFQDYSTVYLTSSADPVSLNSSLRYGFSQHSDPFNADKTDDAVVFAPSLANLSYSPNQADLGTFVQSMTAAVGRRVGELLGLRITANDDEVFTTNPKFDIMSAGGVIATPGTLNTYELSNQNRFLSTGFDTVTTTDFYLGQQNAKSLLDQILLAR